MHLSIFTSDEKLSKNRGRKHYFLINVRQLLCTQQILFPELFLIVSA